MPKPSERVAVKIRMKEAMRRGFEAEARRDGISVNAVIERRLGQALNDDKMTSVIFTAAKEAAKEAVVGLGDLTIEHIDTVMKGVAAEVARIEAKIDSRVLNLHELILSTKKEK
jgi:hypothetical protein